MKTAIIILALLLASCVEQGERTDGSIGIGIIELNEVTMPSGVRCVVAQRPNQSGGPAISCDWESQSE